VREWLNRAARAPRDRAWVAGSVITDKWSPVSPAGVLDAFVWRTPDERLSATRADAEPPSPSAVAPAPPAVEATPEAVAVKPIEPPAADTPRPPPRAGGNVVLLPSNAPDDPGPHGTAERKPGYRMFASE
jgi:HemY protein